VTCNTVRKHERECVCMAARIWESGKYDFLEVVCMRELVYGLWEGADSLVGEKVIETHIISVP
jgi:hypothetical protein